MIRWIYNLVRSLRTCFFTFLAGHLLTSVGRDTVFEGVIDVPLYNRVSIGEQCLVSAGISFVVTATGGINIGQRVYIGKSCVLASDIGVTIGDNTMLAEYVSIIDADHGIEKNGVPIRDQELKPKPITIGSDVWIGRGCAILKGIAIGEGAVIGANSVVTHDIPPYAVACGSPARIIRYR